MTDALHLPPFAELAVLLALAAAAGLVGQILRQPVIVAFIGVGIVAGPAGLGFAAEEEYIDLLAELGIALLLFLVGLKLDLKHVRALGPVALAAGLTQVALTIVLGFGLGVALGLAPVTAMFVAVALAFSSTIIIVKMLSDKREISSVYGRIALGILIVQDLVVVLAMIVLSAAAAGAGAEAGLAEVLTLLATVAAMLAGIGLFMRYVAVPLVHRLADVPELLVAFALGWAALLAALGDFGGLSKELGGLLAGVSLASTPLRDALSARLAPLRDFLLLFFFINLGAGIDPGLFGDQIGVALALSVFVLIAKPVIVFAIAVAAGYRMRTGALAGLALGQISEFSLVFMTLAVTLGFADADALGLITLVALVTIAVSAYVITYAAPLYQTMEPGLERLFGGATGRREAAAGAPAPGYDVVLFGLGRYGGAIAQRMTARGHQVLGVDFNPAAVRSWTKAGVPAVLGDATDPEFVGGLDLDGVAWVISAVPEHELGITHHDPRIALIHSLRQQRYGGRIAVTCHTAANAEALKQAGADLVLLPFQDAADQAVDLLAGQAPQKRLEVVDPEGQQELAE